MTNSSAAAAMQLRNGGLSSMGTAQAFEPATAVARGRWASKLESFLKKVGAADLPVLLQGETGVGKEVVAREIWRWSKRSDKQFLKLNCVALPSELVESELFGYERGAFTGAFRSSPGIFEAANGGTILLDEIGDMDFKLQAKLLQVLQDGEFLKLGSRQTIRVDVRVIAATHRDLEQAISAGTFREDLYYRLNLIRIEIPPLRDRKDEILSLARHFVDKYSDIRDGRIEIDAILQQALLSHSWAGNIRELENVMRKFVVLRDSELVVHELVEARARREHRLSLNGELPVAAKAREHLRATPISETRSAALSSREGADISMAESPFALVDVDNARRTAETDAIVSALNATHWNRKQAASILGIEYKALLYKMKKLRIGTGLVSEKSA